MAYTALIVYYCPLNIIWQARFKKMGWVRNLFSASRQERNALTTARREQFVRLKSIHHGHSFDIYKGVHHLASPNKKRAQVLSARENSGST